MVTAGENRQIKAFLAGCLRGDGAFVRSAAGDPGWDWDRVVPVAAEEALLPGLFGWLEEAGAMPESHKDFFRSVAGANRERNAAILAELHAVVGLLNRLGVEPVLLKGAAYLEMGLYDAPESRYLLDLDLLIEPEALERAVACLSEQGYERNDGDPFAEYRHHYAPLQKERGVSVELHLAPGPAECERILSAAEIRKRAARVSRDGLRFGIPSAEHLAVHSILHSQLQHSYDERIWPPLRGLNDLALLARKFGNEIRWERVLSRFRAAGLDRAYALYLMRLEAELRAVIPGGRRSDPITWLRWQRRQLLRRFPRLRYADPYYMGSILAKRRLAMFFRLLGTDGGGRHLMQQAMASENYLRLWKDVAEGRGR